MQNSYLEGEAIPITSRERRLVGAHFTLLAKEELLHVLTWYVSRFGPREARALIR